MPLYKYKAADEKGTVREVIIDGDSQQDSLNRLRNKGLTPLEFLGLKSDSDESGIPAISFKGRFDVCEFTNMLVPLLSAHVPLERSLGIISQIAPNEDFAQTVGRMRKNLHEGKKFSAIIRDNGSIFPKMYANLIEAGEESGTLPEVVKELARYLNERRETRNFLITSSIYPVFVISVVTLVIAALFIFILPRFSKIFMEMDKPMPLLTRIIFMISRLIVDYWYLWIALIIVSFFTMLYLKKRGILSALWDQYSIKLPIFGKLIIMAEIGRFIRTLSVLIKNHVNVLNSVSISVNVISNTVISKSFSLVALDLKGGKKLSAALSRSPFMPKAALQMLSVGEESAMVADMLEKVADTLEADLKQNIKRILSLYEPIIILILAGIVILVALAIILAIMEIQNI